MRLKYVPSGPNVVGTDWMHHCWIHYSETKAEFAYGTTPDSQKMLPKRREEKQALESPRIAGKIERRWWGNWHVL